MSFKKKILALAAVGALSVATAIPAMAFENEFHGMYKLKYFLSNYETGTFGAIGAETTVAAALAALVPPAAFVAPAPTGDAAVDFANLNTATAAYAAKVTAFNAANAAFQHNTENRRMNNYFEQRARLQYIAKASDDLKLVTHFEIDSVWGDKAQGLATRNQGGAMEADAVNLETKSVYLDFKIPSTPTRVTAGIQPYKDMFKGVFLDCDLAGANSVTKLGNATVNLGYFRAYDQSYFSTTTRPRGMDNLDVLSIATNYAVNKDLNVGLGYILYTDSRNGINANGAQNAGNIDLNVIGLNADAKIGPVAVSGFAAMQTGTLKSGATAPLFATAVPGGAAQSFNYNGFAFNVAAKMPVGPGSARTAFLFTSGDDSRDGHNTAWQSVDQTQGVAGGTFGTAPGTNSYNDSHMMLLSRDTSMQGTSTDASLVYNTGNKDQGVWLYTLGYDATITPKLYANANLGFAWAAKDNANKPLDFARINTTGVGPGSKNASNFMGTEINIETGYKMYDNLTASVQAAYVILGGYYENSALTALPNGKIGVHAPEDPYTARFVLSYLF